MPNIKLTELDFDGIKQNLKEFLQGQEEFKDYNFEGSALSTLLDVLASNTYYFSFYLNMVANELFLDSATKRDSIVSLAKHLGYTPRSTRSARSNVSITNNTGSIITLTRENIFLSEIDGKTYYFTPETNINIENNQTSSVTLVEGVPVKFKYVVNGLDNEQKFIIPSTELDTTTLKVGVRNGTTVGGPSSIVSYSLDSDFVTIDNDSTVYFLEEVENYQYKILFGDGVLGKAVENGNEILLEYLISSGTLGNGATSFTSPIQNVIVSNVETSIGGQSRETDESIKFIAPRFFESQNRAVTANDFRALLLKERSNIEALSVWGGQDHVPPTYGKVFISIKPQGKEKLTNGEKQDIIDNVLTSKSIISVIPEIVDPDYLYLNIDLSCRFDERKSNTTATILKTDITGRIINYAKSELSNFDKNFRYSKLLISIDEIDPGIVSVNIDTEIAKKVYVNLNASNKISQSFYNEIEPGTFTSSSFIVTDEPGLFYSAGDTHSFDDDGLGNIRLIRTNSSGKIVLNSNFGTINYTTGDILIFNFKPSSLSGNIQVELRAKTVDYDVFVQRNGIILVNTDSINVTVKDALQ